MWWVIDVRCIRHVRLCSGWLIDAMRPWCRVAGKKGSHSAGVFSRLGCCCSDPLDWLLPLRFEVAARLKLPVSSTTRPSGLYQTDWRPLDCTRESKQGEADNGLSLAADPPLIGRASAVIRWPSRGHWTTFAGRWSCPSRWHPRRTGGLPLDSTESVANALSHRLEFEAFATFKVAEGSRAPS